MKRLMRILLALALVCTALAGCSQEKADPTGVYYELTGVAPDEVVMTIDGEEIPAELYFYWSLFNCATLDQQIHTYNMYYGMYPELVDAETGALNWQGDMGSGKTAIETAGEMAEGTLRFMLAVEKTARENGVILTEEDQAELAQSQAELTEKVGGPEGYQKYLETLGVTQETLTRVNQASILFRGLQELALQEGSSLYMDPQEFSGEIAYADHILFSTKDEEGKDLPEKEKKAKYKSAEETLAQLRAAGDDVTALFTQLGDELSEDPGRLQSPDGYIFGKGQMVKPFEDAAFALEPGQVSDIVESDFGYHILLRKDLTEGLEKHPEEKENLARTHVENLLDETAEAMTVTAGEALEGFDLERFYTDYSLRTEAANKAAQEEASQGENPEAADGGETSEDTGE